MKKPKRARKLAALLIAAAMTLGAGAFSVSAEDFADLSYKEVTFSGEGNQVLGKYPTNTGIGGLDAKIYARVLAEYAAYQSTVPNGAFNTFTVSFKVNNNGQFADIVMTFTGAPPYISASAGSITQTYFIDKDAAKEIATEAEYKEKIDAAKEAAEAAEAGEDEPAASEDGSDETPAESDGGEEAAEPGEAAEIVMVQLRQCATPLGFALKWDGETRTVTVSMGDFSASMVIGVNAYTVGEETVELDAAPQIQNDYTMVPLSFFERILGCVVNVAEDGTIIIALPDLAAEADAA